MSSVMNYGGVLCFAFGNSPCCDLGRGALLLLQAGLAEQLEQAAGRGA